MTHRSRVMSGLTLLLVMLGSPLAPVLCELSCPQASRPSLAAADPASPCHEAAVAAPDEKAGRATVFGLGPAPGHQCDHPSLLSAPRGSHAPRVPEPSAVVWGTSRHLSPFRAGHADAATWMSTRAPSPPSGPAFALVLRI